MDAGGRATQEAKAEGSPNDTKCLRRSLNRCAHIDEMVSSLFFTRRHNAP